MQAFVIWVLAVYGVTVVLNWLVIKFYGIKQQQPVLHYVVYTYHSQARIEWVIRSLSQVSRHGGQPFCFYIIDCGSNDDTLKIIDRLEKSGIQIVKCSHFPAELSLDDQHVHVIDIREDCCSCELRTT